MILATILQPINVILGNDCQTEQSLNWQEPETKRQETTMSKLTKNGKNVIVEMSVSYNYKNDSITLTPHDEDMIGKPFLMTFSLY